LVFLKLTTPSASISGFLVLFPAHICAHRNLCCYIEYRTFNTSVSLLFSLGTVPGYFTLELIPRRISFSASHTHTHTHTLSLSLSLFVRVCVFYLVCCYLVYLVAQSSTIELYQLPTYPPTSTHRHSSIRTKPTSNVLAGALLPAAGIRSNASQRFELPKSDSNARKRGVAYCQLSIAS
jgi:hypothetical protein